MSWTISQLVAHPRSKAGKGTSRRRTKLASPGRTTAGAELPLLPCATRTPWNSPPPLLSAATYVVDDDGDLCCNSSDSGSWSCPNNVGKRDGRVQAPPGCFLLGVEEEDVLVQRDGRVKGNGNVGGLDVVHGRQRRARQGSAARRGRVADVVAARPSVLHVEQEEALLQCSTLAQSCRNTGRRKG